MKSFIQWAIRLHKSMVRAHRVHQSLRRWTPPTGIDVDTSVMDDGSVIVRLTSEAGSISLDVRPHNSLGVALYEVLDALAGKLLPTVDLTSDVDCDCPACRAEADAEEATARAMSRASERFERNVESIRTRRPMYGEG